MAELKLKIDCRELMEVCQMIIEDWLDPNGDPNTEGITLGEFCGAATRLQGVAKSRDMLAVLVATNSMDCRLEACERGIESLKMQGLRQEAKLDTILSMLTVEAAAGKGVISRRSGNQSPPPVPEEEARSVSNASRGSDVSNFQPRPPAPTPAMEPWSQGHINPQALIKKGSVSVPCGIDSMTSQHSAAGRGGWCSEEPSYDTVTPSPPHGRRQSNMGLTDFSSDEQQSVRSPTSSLRSLRGSLSTEGNRGVASLMENISRHSAFSGSQTVTSMKEYSGVRNTASWKGKQGIVEAVVGARSRNPSAERGRGDGE
mmetsp:Transcript_37002/g.92892  ORF Transcript_37002/g.92892 Transcript_37002/m.92892 type:complete len:314 (+) Transcript_37002:2-943(+)